jgi:hypothetical protein
MRHLRIDGKEGGPLIVSDPPNGKPGDVQVDIGDGRGGLVYVVLGPRQAKRAARALMAPAEGRER